LSISVKKNEIIYWIFLISCFFPFLNIFRLPTDTQPNALLLSVFILIFNHKKLINHFPSKFLLFLCIGVLSFILLLFSSITVDSVFSFTSYISLIFIPIAVFISLNKVGGLSKHFFLVCILIWLFVALIQKLFYPDFLSFLLNRSSGSGLMGRGVNSLAPEPTYYATIIALFLVIHLLNFKMNYKLLIYLLLFQLFILSISSTIFAVFLITFFIYFIILLFRKKISKTFFISIALFIILILSIFFLFQENISESRFYKIGQIILNNPEFILKDESINERLNHAIFPLISLFDHYGFPMGFNRFQDYIIFKMNDENFSIFFENINLDHYKKIMSGYGAVFFELGLLGFLIPYYLFSIFKTVINNRIYLFSFVLLNLLIFTSISLNNSLILFVFGNVLYLKQDNFN